MLKFLASIYDPVGLISPVTLLAKDMYRDACDLKDQRLPEDLMKRWTKWIKSLSRQQIDDQEVYQYIMRKKSQLPFMFLQTSIQGEYAVYAVVDRPKGKSQGLLISNKGLAKKNLTVPNFYPYGYKSPIQYKNSPA